eukprot:TRINITY_DN5647_c0_g1_i1.p1 TRINITY_DN5647_c0_g1~~TRINITY_DN5647_c0_g1_i1.p1  ORF type:complete len:253 (-),score=51.04 TRINITY_DN5647_c0_g1_i1:158-916(-)
MGCLKHLREHFEQEGKGHSLSVQLNSSKFFCQLCKKKSYDEDSEANDKQFLVNAGKTSSESETTPAKHHGSRTQESKRRSGGGGSGNCGLLNLGNTCYMNSAIQALSHCLPFKNFFLEYEDFWEPRKQPLVHDYANLIADMWNGPLNVLNPKRVLLDVVSVNRQLAGFNQQDSQEFVRCFLDLMHENLKQQVFVKVPERFGTVVTCAPIKKEMERERIENSEETEGEENRKQEKQKKKKKKKKKVLCVDTTA